MSTKQIVIFSFMMVFLAAMLFGLGAWFHLSLELDIKKKALEDLKVRDENQKLVIDGDANTYGSKKMNDDPLDGLRQRVDKERQRVTNIIGAPGIQGVEFIRTLYEGTAADIDKQWQDAKESRKKFYDSWKTATAAVQAAVGRFAAAVAENDSKVAAAQAELDTAIETEKTTMRDIVLARKNRADEIRTIRNQLEEVLDKRAKVTREIQAEREVVPQPQGKIVNADEAVKTVAIDIGSFQGVRKGMQFDVYSGAHLARVKKGRIEITDVGSRSAYAVILGPKLVKKFDPFTFWEAPDPAMKYSVYSAGANDDTAQELELPKSRADRLEDVRLDEIKRMQGLEAAEKYLAEKEAPSSPVIDLGRGFVPIVAGDWINNTDFIPIVPDAQFQKQSVNDLLSMTNVSTSPLTFYFTDAVPQYRKEFLKRLCERNLCSSADTVSSDVSYVVTSASKGTSIDRLERQQRDSRAKDSPGFKADQAILDAMKEGKKYGAEIIADNELEAFFTRRNHKIELLRGKTTQPGQSTFYIAGETRDRSVAHLQQWIRDHGGVVATEMTGNVDYVVTGAGLKEDFYKLVKEKGLKIIREDELPKFFGQ